MSSFIQDEEVFHSLRESDRDQKTTEGVLCIEVIFSFKMSTPT